MLVLFALLTLVELEEQLLQLLLGSAGLLDLLNDLGLGGSRGCLWHGKNIGQSPALHGNDSD